MMKIRLVMIINFINVSKSFLNFYYFYKQIGTFPFDSHFVYFVEFHQGNYMHI